MSDTLTNFRARIRRRLDETTARFWLDADLDAWINEGARDIARRSEVLQATTTINSTSGTQSYSLPTNVHRIHRVEWSRDGSTGSSIQTLEYRDFNSMDGVWWSQQKTSRGDPYWFTMWGFPPSLNMIVYPTPDVSVTAGFNVYYYRIPTTATNGSDTVEVPAGWDDLVDEYCEYMAMRKDANPSWVDAKTIYEQKLANMIETTRRWTDQADAIQSRGGPLPRWIWDPGYGG